jgi:hypothetical protein
MCLAGSALVLLRDERAGLASSVALPATLGEEDDMSGCCARTWEETRHASTAVAARAGITIRASKGAAKANINVNAIVLKKFCGRSAVSACASSEITIARSKTRTEYIAPVQ